MHREAEKPEMFVRDTSADRVQAGSARRAQGKVEEGRWCGVGISVLRSGHGIFGHDGINGEGVRLHKHGRQRDYVMDLACE